MCAEKLRKKADRLADQLEREQQKESLPGGLFGTFWSDDSRDPGGNLAHGSVAVRSRLRDEAARRWRRIEDEIRRLRAAADATAFDLDTTQGEASEQMQSEITRARADAFREALS